MDDLPEQPKNGLWTLRCRVCVRAEVIDTKRVTTFLSVGFPVCCGAVMTFTIERSTVVKELP
jgi:hypothetical protein